jgi:1-acyl-sn-glycerol-3-phosphate acyltransferase
VRTILYLGSLVVATMTYGMACVIAGIFRVKYVRGGIYDRCQEKWARMIIGAAGIPVTLSGVEHLPGGPQIVAANHASFFDILALLAWLPGYPKFIAKRELFAIPVLGAAMRAAGHVRLDRGNRGQAFSAYEEASKEMMAEGLTVVVYPEGTRTRTGELLPFKKGPFVFAIGSGAPLVPCYVGGAFDIQPKGSIRVRPRPVHIALGAPIKVAGMAIEERDDLLERVRTEMQAIKTRVDATLAAA